MQPAVAVVVGGCCPTGLFAIPGAFVTGNEKARDDPGLRTVVRRDLSVHNAIGHRLVDQGYEVRLLDRWSLAHILLLENEFSYRLSPARSEDGGACRASPGAPGSAWETLLASRSRKPQVHTSSGVASTVFLSRPARNLSAIPASRCGRLLTFPWAIVTVSIAKQMRAHYHRRYRRQAGQARADGREYGSAVPSKQRLEAGTFDLNVDSLLELADRPGT
jgi:hypothetical protein